MLLFDPLYQWTRCSVHKIQGEFMEWMSDALPCSPMDAPDIRPSWVVRMSADPALSMLEWSAEALCALMLAAGKEAGGASASASASAVSAGEDAELGGADEFENLPEPVPASSPLWGGLGKDAKTAAEAIGISAAA